MSRAVTRRVRRAICPTFIRSCSHTAPERNLVTDSIVLFERAIDGFGAHVHSVRADQWHNETPDTEWDVRILVNHVTVEQLWVPPLVGGKTVADVGTSLHGDQLGAEPHAPWYAYGAA